MQGTEQDITNSVQEEIKKFNETFLKNSGGKKLTNVFKTNDGYLFIISSLPGPAYDRDGSKDYEKNKTNTRKGKYADIYIKSNKTNKQDAFKELKSSFEGNHISSCRIQINNNKKSKIYFTSPEIITNEQNNLQEILRSAIADRNEEDFNLANSYIAGFNNEFLKNEDGNFIFNNIDRKKYTEIKKEYKLKTKDNLDKKQPNKENEEETKRLLKEAMSFKCFNKKEQEIIPPIEAKKHELNLGSEQLLQNLKEKLEQDNKERPPLSKIKSKSIKDIIFEDEFRKFCIDNNIDKNKKLSDLKEQQIQEFKQRLNEAEHNYPCNIKKEIEEEQLLKEFFKDFEIKLSEEIEKFLKEEKQKLATRGLNDDAQEIEKILNEKKDEQLLFDEKNLTNLHGEGVLSEVEQKQLYSSILALKKEAYAKLIKEQKYRDIKLDFGFDKQVFEGTVLRHNKNIEKKIKKLFFSKNTLDKATKPLHDNIQIISAYQCALGNNQMKIYGDDIMEDCHSRKYITGEDLEENYYDLHEQITQDIKYDTRAHNRLTTNIFVGDENGKKKRLATPISAKARIKYILTNIINDNHVNNYFYKIGKDKNEKQIITEIIQFDYDKDNKKENQDNITFSFKTLANVGESNNDILPWIYEACGTEDESFNVKEELDIFLKEVNKIITIEPKMMFNIIAYRLSLTDVKVAEKLDVIHNLMIQHIDLLGKLQDKINNSLSSLEESKYHKNNIYREYGEKLKYIAKSVLPEKINFWKEKLKQQEIINTIDKKEKKRKATEVMKNFFNTGQVIPQIQKDIEEYNNKKEQNEKEERIKEERIKEERIKEERIKEERIKEEEERKKIEEEKKKNSGQFDNTKNSILINNLIGNTDENDKNLMNIPEKLIDPTKISQNNYTNNKTYKKTNNTNDKTEHTNKKQHHDNNNNNNKEINNSHINNQVINLEAVDDGKQGGCCAGCSFFKFK